MTWVPSGPAKLYSVIAEWPSGSRREAIQVHAQDCEQAQEIARSRLGVPFKEWYSDNVKKTVREGSWET